MDRGDGGFLDGLRRPLGLICLVFVFEEGEGNEVVFLGLAATVMA